ncbi:hypothetical protein ACIQZB_38070 [Streptomyces sp. NPDC097727]|uniref:hypothetical protein n=1 Tax=Streptomyces sp. NPDC097727 TaxID=3366092 RepID=UPI00382E5571
MALLRAGVPRDYGRLDPAAADLASPWLAWAKYLAHQFAEARGWGCGIRFAVNRGLAIVLTGYAEGDVIRHSEIFTPLRALDLRVGHVITVLEEMGIFLDDEEPCFERWLAEHLEGIAPGIAAEAERWTRVLREGGPRSLPRQQATTGQAAVPVFAFAPGGSAQDVRAALTRGLSLATLVSVGDRAHAAPAGLPPLDGTVVWSDDERIAVRSTDAIYTFHHGSGRVLMFHHLFGPDTDGAEAAWQHWLTGLLG